MATAAASSSPYVCRTCGGSASLRTADGAPRVFCANRACGAVYRFESGPSAPSVQLASSPPCAKPGCGGGGLLRTSGPESKNAGRQYYACGRCNAFISFVDNDPRNSAAAAAAAAPSSSAGAAARGDVCKCGLPAKLITCGPQSKSPGRQKLVCPRPREQDCGFYRWADEGAGAAGASVGAGAAAATAGGEVVCECRPPAPAKLCTSGAQAKHPGRQFYGCAKARESVDRCRFFKWADEVDQQNGQQQSRSTPTAATTPAAAAARAPDGALLCACHQPPASAVVNGTVMFRCALRACAFVKYNNDMHSKEPPWQQKMRAMCAEALKRRAERDGAGVNLEAPITKDDVVALIALSQAEIDLIASYPQGSAEWMLAHWLRIGGSNIGACIGLNPHKSRTQALREIVFGQQPFQNVAMTFGLKMESYSRLQYLAFRGGQLYESFAQHFGIDAEDMMHARLSGTKRARPATFRSMLQRLDGDAGAGAGAAVGAGAGAVADSLLQSTTAAPSFREPNFRVQLANFTIHPKMRHLGASPDGVVLYTDPASGVERRGVLEIKTRMGAALATDFSDSRTSAAAGSVSGSAGEAAVAAAPAGVPLHYFAQCVLNMAIQRATFADFVVCNTGTLRVSTIEWSDAVQLFWNRMYREATEFYMKAVIPCAVDALNGAIAADAALDAYILRATHGDDAVEVADARAAHK